MKLSVGVGAPVEFEGAVRAIEQSVRANLEKRRELIARDRRYSAPRIDSMRHGDAIHTIGLSCHAADDTYALCINVSAVHGLGLRAFAFWSHPFVRYQSPGFLVYEGVTPSFRCPEAGGLDDFMRELEPLYTAFDQGLQRGHPPEPENANRMK